MSQIETNMKKYTDKFIPTHVILADIYSEDYHELKELNYKTFNNWDDVPKYFLIKNDILKVSNFLNSMNNTELNLNLFVVQFCVLKELNK